MIETAMETLKPTLGVVLLYSTKKQKQTYHKKKLEKEPKNWKFLKQAKWRTEKTHQNKAYVSAKTHCGSFLASKTKPMSRLRLTVAAS